MFSVFTPVITTSIPVCPYNFLEIAISSALCFWLSGVHGYYKDAVAECARWGGVLAMLKDQDVYEKVIIKFGIL